MKAITKNHRDVREALAHEGWRFSVVSSVEAFNHHTNGCRTLILPSGSQSDNRVRTIQQQRLRQLPLALRGQSLSRWLSYISKDARRRLQPHLPVAAEFCLTHGFIFLVADVWAERSASRWRIHREDAPAVLLEDRELYFWRGWQVWKETLID